MKNIKSIIKTNISGIEEREKIYLETNENRIKETFKLVKINQGDKILEIGCDSGLFSLVLKNAYSDFSHKAIEVDGERLKKAMERGIDGKIVNLENGKLPFNGNNFDQVFFTEVIEHLQNPINALIEIKRVLKPGGILYLSTPNAVGLYERYAHLRGISPCYIPFLKKNSRKGEFGEHYYVYEFTQMKKLLQEYNFEIKDFRFSRYNHQRRGLLVKLIERMSKIKNNWSDIMIFKCVNSKK